MSDYITLTELKVTGELVGFSFADYDGQAAITAACDGINQYCGRVFYPSGTAVTRYYTPRERDYVQIDDLITGSTTPTVASDWDGDRVYETAWAASDYLLEPLNAAADGKPYDQLRRHPNSGLLFPYWPASVSVTGQFGWASPPAAVKQATTILAMRLLRRAREAPFGVVGLGLDNAPVRISRTDPDVSFLLDPYIKGDGVLAA